MRRLQSIDVLLVEDSFSDAELTLRTLRKDEIGERVYWVKDGAEALDFMFREGAYVERDSSQKLLLVLLDLRMPKVGGIEVLRRLKGDIRTRTTPVVILTSSDEPRDIAETYRLGVNSYIVKPVKLAAFREVVSQVGRYWVYANQVPAG
jgi:CheY-like chemotaxis protein